MTAITEKRALRLKLRGVLALMSDAQKSAESEILRSRLAGLPEWRNARSVLLFSPLPDEPDIRPLFDVALLQRKNLALPRYSPREGCYQAAQVSDPTVDLVPGLHGIAEPALACPSFNLKQLDLTLVPGLGFTLNGSRLGRGKGFYDRLLTMVSGITCGIAFSGQITAQIPDEPHDVRLSCILTPTSWRSDPGRPRF